MPPSCSSSGLGAIIHRQACHSHSTLRKAGLRKWKEFQGLLGAQRERCVLIPNVNVCLSNFSSDLPSLPSPSSVWVHPAQTVLSALPTETWRMRLQIVPLHSAPLPPAGQSSEEESNPIAPSLLLLYCSRSDKQQPRRSPSAEEIMIFALR